MGTLINIIAIIAGTIIGLIFKSGISQRFRNIITTGLGLFTLALGLKMSLDMQESLVVLVSILLGGLLGELLRIERNLERFGSFLENIVIRLSSKRPILESEETSKSSPASSKFVRGFIASSLVYIIGPMALLGSIQDGLSGDYNLLTVKSIMDGVASIAFATTFGIGVLFSSLSVLIYQGTITLTAVQIQSVFSPDVLNELTAVGGIILIGISLSNLLKIIKIKVSNFLPALVVTPIIIHLLTHFHILYQK